MKKVLKIIFGLIVIVVIGGALSGGDSDSKSKNSESKPPEEINWNMNLDDENAAVTNTKLCVKAMKQMDDVAANAKPVSASEVVENPAQYVGQVLEFSAVVINAENMPSDSNGAKLFGGNGYALEAVSDGVYIMTFRKGTTSNKAIGKEVKIVGMLAGLQTTPDMGKGLLVIGSPK